MPTGKNKKQLLFSKEIATKFQDSEKLKGIRQKAIDGQLSLEQTKHFLSHLKYFIHLDYYHYLKVLSIHSELVEQIFQQPELCALLSKLDITVLCMNHPSLIPQAVRVFGLDYADIDYVKKEFDSATSKQKTSVDARPEKSQDVQNFLIDIGLQSTLNAHAILNLKGVSQALGLNDVANLAEQKESVAQRMLDDKSMHAQLTPNLIVRISHNHPNIISQVADSSLLWGKLSTLQRMLLATLNENAAHKLLDKKQDYKQLSADFLLELGRSNLCVSDRILKMPKLVKKLYDDQVHQLQRKQALCNAVAQYLGNLSPKCFVKDRTDKTRKKAVMP